MTNHDKTKVLAEKVMGWRYNDGSWYDSNGYFLAFADFPVLRFDPFSNRNHLADVIGKLTQEQWMDAWNLLFGDGVFPNSDRWLLTCDPALIARAVAKVVSNQDGQRQ